MDILQRVGGGFGLIEVKSSTSAKPEHLPDVGGAGARAAQSRARRRSVEIMHLNRACTYPDLDDLFTRTDVTGEVDELLPDVPALVAGLLKMVEGRCPTVPIGPHCRTPTSARS